MPEQLLINDFSAGWCPSDDPINGRKNGLLKMDNLELDQNGAVRLTGGSTLLFTHTVDAHTIYAKFLKDAQYYYAALTNNKVFRNSTEITSGGSTTRAAFSAIFDFVIICSGALRKRDDGTTVTSLGIVKPTVKPTVALGAAGLLNGTYQYIQINITNSGAYIARSPVGPISDEISPVDQIVTVTPETPGAGITEVWIFRRGEDLSQFYRIARQTSSLGAAISDNMTDIDALLDNVTLDVNALTVNSTDLPDDILEVVAPVKSRVLYFSKNAIHFSEVNSPDSYHAGQSIYFAGGATGAEIFLSARKVSENVVLVNTTRDTYILTGTFITQPDGTLDIDFRSLGVENPSISIDVDTYNGNLVYMTSAGWKITSPDGNQINLCDERVDRIYRGESLYGIGGVPIYILPQYRYSCAVVRDKLYVRVPQIVGSVPTDPFTYRMECYDFKRKYWRPITQYNPLMIIGKEDDSVVGFFGSSHTIRSIDDQFTKLNNGDYATINFLTTIQDAGAPRRRKDSYTLKFKINTGGNAVAWALYIDDGLNAGTFGNVNTSHLTEVAIDLNAAIPTPTKNWQIEFNAITTEFILSDITIDYDVRPQQLSTVVIIPSLGPNKKRIRTWPIKLDNLNSAVTCTPYIDGVTGTTSTFAASSVEKMFYHQFLTDVFGVDYKIKLTSTSLFEIYETPNPEIVQILPIAKRFDQLGPIELFKYGKLKELQVRMIAFGTTIPYVIYFEDSSEATGNITTVSGKEQCYEINLPKSVAGSVIRIELGPTNFDFHTFYGRVKTAKSGRDTENEWIIFDQRVSNGTS